MKKSLFFLTTVFVVIITLMFTQCNKPSNVPPTVELKLDVSANQTTIIIGSSAIITWVSNADTVTINDSTVSQSGTLHVAPIQNTSYTINASLTNEVTKEVKQITEVVIIYVTQDPPDHPYVTFVIDPPVQPIGGGTPTISWTSQNADSVNIDSSWYGPSGSITLWFITSDTAISYIVKGPGGEKNGMISIFVTHTPPPLTIDEMLTYATWKILHLEENYPTIDPSVWDTIDIAGSCVSDNTLTFSVTPQKMVLDSGPMLCEGETITVWTYSWTRNDSIISGFGDRSIKSITIDTLIWTSESVAVIGDSIVAMTVRETFVH